MSDGSGFDTDYAARVDRIAGVENKIDEHLLDIAAIDCDPQRPIGYGNREFHILGEQARQHGLGIFYNPVQIEDSSIPLPVAAENKELAGERCRLATGIFDLHGVLAQSGSLTKPGHQQTAVGHDDCENVVVVVGDAPGEFSEDFELLRARELVAERFSITQKSRIVQRTPHSRSQTRETVFQNIVCCAISQ